MSNNKEENSAYIIELLNNGWKSFCYEYSLEKGLNSLQTNPRTMIIAGVEAAYSIGSCARKLISVLNLFDTEPNNYGLGLTEVYKEVESYLGYFSHNLPGLPNEFKHYFFLGDGLNVMNTNQTPSKRNLLDYIGANFIQGIISTNLTPASIQLKINIGSEWFPKFDYYEYHGKKLWHELPLEYETLFIFNDFAITYLPKKGFSYKGLEPVTAHKFNHQAKYFFNFNDLTSVKTHALTNQNLTFPEDYNDFSDFYINLLKDNGKAVAILKGEGGTGKSTLAKSIIDRVLKLGITVIKCDGKTFNSFPYQIITSLCPGGLMVLLEEADKTSVNTEFLHQVYDGTVLEVIQDLHQERYTLGILIVCNELPEHYNGTLVREGRVDKIKECKKSFLSGTSQK
jgi:hypothetical protein